MPYLPAILATAFVLVILLAWLICAARELSRTRSELSIADKQMALYRLLHAKAQSGAERQRTAEQVALSQTIYQNVAAEYNRCIARPKNRLMAGILGYRPAPEVKTE